MNPVISRIMSEASMPVSLKRRGRANIVPPIMELSKAKMVFIEEFVGADFSDSVSTRACLDYSISDIMLMAF